MVMDRVKTQVQFPCAKRHLGVERRWTEQSDPFIPDAPRTVYPTVPLQTLTRTLKYNMLRRSSRLGHLALSSLDSQDICWGHDQEMPALTTLMLHHRFLSGWIARVSYAQKCLSRPKELLSAVFGSFRRKRRPNAMFLLSKRRGCSFPFSIEGLPAPFGLFAPSSM